MFQVPVKGSYLGLVDSGRYQISCNGFQKYVFFMFGSIFESQLMESIEPSVNMNHFPTIFSEIGQNGFRKFVFS